MPGLAWLRRVSPGANLQRNLQRPAYATIQVIYCGHQMDVSRIWYIDVQVNRYPISSNRAELFRLDVHGLFSRLASSARSRRDRMLSSQAGICRSCCLEGPD